jgi:murein DD-endopeptidase MepM/ murein hydrolase activator NlpD
VIGGRTHECYGWGQPVHAAFDGEVVAAVDGVPERQWLHVVRELALVVKNAVTFDPAKGVTRLAGNHVVMRTDGMFALSAHLAPGSVAVKPGDAVRAGDVIGRSDTPGTRPSRTCTSS